MLLFIEGYKYRLDYIVKDGKTVKDILRGVISVPELENTISPKYVGYCYNKDINDVIFFLPKVVLTGESLNEDDSEDDSVKDTIFGASPEEIIDFDSSSIKDKFNEEGSKNYKEFLSSLSIWIYRTISVYKQTNNENILESREHLTESRGKKQKHNTLLDVIIALRDFNRNNQDYFTFITKNLHSGINKIHWNKTISHTQAVIHNNRPIYVNPVNKKKVINFDEELLVIYFSILNYIHQEHGFDFEINFNYDLIPPNRMKKSYIEKRVGCRRLKQIKYKYFSDKALRIWDLCYAFFDREYRIAMNHISRDYLLAKDFDHVFEVMIDTLVGETNIPKDLKKQKDGKMVDHMFIGQGLIEQANIDRELTYYIGDSKYYKRVKDGVKLGETSIYKQYTYARNVVQWNIDLFLDEKDASGQPQLRDKLTEGYNPIPNFFISARIPTLASSGKKFLSFEDYELKTQDRNVLLNRQFENRLFDRDTLLLCHYDVNFLFLVALYGRNNKNKQAWWRDYVRKEFRERIQSTLNNLYSFRIISPRPGKDCNLFIKNNFHLLNGKIYRPHIDSQYLVLALMKTEEDEFTELFKEKARVSESDANEKILDSLQSHFEISEPFVLTDEGISSLVPPEVGSIEPQAPIEKKKDSDFVETLDGSFLTCVVRKTEEGEDADEKQVRVYETFRTHKAEGLTYVMLNMPSGSFSEAKYLLPIVDNSVDGYYEIARTGFGKRTKKMKDGQSIPGYPTLRITIGAYHPFNRTYTKGVVPKMSNQVWSPEKLKEYVFDKHDPYAVEETEISVEAPGTRYGMEEPEEWGYFK